MPPIGNGLPPPAAPLPVFAPAGAAPLPLADATQAAAPVPLSPRVPAAAALPPSTAALAVAAWSPVPGTEPAPDLGKLGERLGQLELATEARSYEQAIGCAERGEQADRLMSVFGLTEGEANLVTLLHGDRARRPVARKSA